MPCLRYLNLIFIATIVAIVGCSAVAGANSPSSGGWQFGETCYLHGKYVSGCCCAARDAKPGTRTVKVAKTSLVKTTSTSTFVQITATSTFTATQTLGAKYADAQRRDFVGRYVEGVEWDSAADAQQPRELFKRHVCPICPLGSSPASSTSVPKEDTKFCCAPKKFVTKIKMITRTKAVVAGKTTVTVKRAATKTITAMVQSIKGQLYYDVNSDSRYTSRIDVPLANLPISLLVAQPAGNKLSARALSVLAKTVTSNNGSYVFNNVTVSSNQNLTIANGNGQVLQTASANAQGVVFGGGLQQPVSLPLTSTSVVGGGVTTEQQATTVGSVPTSAVQPPAVTTVPPNQPTSEATPQLSSTTQNIPVVASSAVSQVTNAVGLTSTIGFATTLIAPPTTSSAGAAITTAPATTQTAGQTQSTLTVGAVTTTVAGALTTTAVGGHWPSAGSILFVGYNAEIADNLAFVAIDTIPSGAKIFFTDNEWNGTWWTDTGETSWSWTATSQVASGTVILINQLNGTGSPSTNIGTVGWESGLGTGKGLTTNAESVFAFLTAGAVNAAPTVFLTAFASDVWQSSTGNLTGTGLTVGSTAINFTGGIDVAAYNYAVAGRNFTSRANALSTIYSSSNWVTQDGVGDQSVDGTFPDVPFNTTAYQICA